jgi:hypothetical protein
MSNTISVSIPLAQVEPLVLQKHIDRRRGYKASMPVTKLQAQHTQNCRILPDRETLLLSLESNGVCAEIGAAFGDYTASILDLNKPKELHLIDAWDSERYRAGLEQIRDKFKPEIMEGRLHIHQDYSTQQLMLFDDGFFDWVYIDTDHSYQTTWDELLLCNKKVKKNGFIAGHDFCTGNVVTPVPYGVIQAVTKFCVDYNWQYRFITLESHGHFSFCLGRLDT